MSERPEWLLKAAGGLAAAETLMLIVVLGFSGAPLAPYVIGAMLLKLPFCFFVTQRRPGALMGLVVWEVAGLLAALRPGPSIVLRLVEAGLAAVVFGLLLASVPLFPSVRLPEK
ncbi:MAG: hypothetical protein QOG87_456 [Actinomycetota bacterium]